MIYSLTPRQTNAVSLLMICSMVARYAPPISYNFLNLISLGGGKKTIFEKRMGKIDDAVPFFGHRFNTIYPLIMVVYTILVASNFFDRIISFFGNWKIFGLHKEADDTDGFDPSGMLILKKERTWLEQGRKVGEHVIPLARNFDGASTDIEPGANADGNAVEMKGSSYLIEEDTKASSSKPSNNTGKNSGSKEAISSKYAAIREQSKSATNTEPAQGIAVSKVSSLDSDNSQPGNGGTPSGLALKWASMKQGFQAFKANIEAKKFLPLRQVHETELVDRASSSESLDDIFQRLRRPAEDHHDEGEYDLEITLAGRNR